MIRRPEVSYGLYYATVPVTAVVCIVNYIMIQRPEVSYGLCNLYNSIQLQNKI